MTTIDLASTRARIRAALCDEPVYGISLDQVADTIARTVTGLRQNPPAHTIGLADQLHQAVGLATKGTS